MNIFVSYSSRNRAIVKSLVSDLSGLNHHVWYDGELDGAQVWWNKILAEIRNCDLFIFAVSEDALASEACKLELNYAYELNRNILPILLSDDIRISLLPVVLQERQFVNYSNQDKASLLALINAINGITSTPKLPDPLPNPPAVPISPLAKIRTKL
ncbi:MAG TPA: toll/interleukin-1 receptor domain-containing protein, partial [Aggregatilineales bacterium]|nr:toll/interleukin-1 receptor domain-containing protein [Aggregatilineales bacterium]